ncbi:MAG: M48 family metalloprotease [Proteobacteria bacterium]|nr:M48 family metalloprotease [Pseudomonadota bacterium]MCP4917544.1 M48 family metalloprotease [Pseudomonadota bacterium]
MNAQTIRAEADARLYRELSENEAVQRMRAAIDSQPGGGTRRSLLARALRLNGAIAPDELGIVEHCREVLDAELDVELYVYPSADFNAACTQPEDGRVFVLLSSSLLEGFTPAELQYVVGHELGHHVYGHHAIPLGALVAHAKDLPRRLVLRAHTWQRHAEISADRAGLLCCDGDLTGAASSLFKLSSGLRESPGQGRIGAFLAQAEELYAQSQSDSEQGLAHRDWLSTHPFSPLRLRALREFARMFDGSGQTMPAVELACQDLMELMEATYVEEDSPSAEAMRRLLFAAGAVVAASDREVHPSEIAALRSLLGHGNVPDSFNIEALRGVMPERIQAVRERCRGARRAQLMRDLCRIARADHRIHEAERAELASLARALDVDVSLIHETLDAPIELD